MNRKQTITLTLLALLTLVLALGCYYEALNHQNRVNTAVVSAQKQRDAAIAETAQHDRSNKLQLDSALGLLTTEKAKTATLCTQLKTAKLTNALCQ